jgi:hypothetical protein
MKAAHHTLMRAACALATLALIAGCATTTQPGPAVAAPEVRPGDRWVYRGVDGFRVRVEWEETHEVVSVAPGDIVVDVKLRGDTADIDRTERWSAPGIVLQGAVYEAETSVFDPPLVRFGYPLTPGTSWRQAIRDTEKPPGPYGPIMRSVAVRGYEQITTPAGTFDAIRMSVFMRMDDETFWRWPTECEYTVWYAPAVGAIVQEDRRSHWRDKGGMDAASYHPGQNGRIQLVAWSRPR